MEASKTLSAHQSVVSLQSGPCDGAALKFHSDAIAVVRQPLTINHFSACHILVQRSNPYHIVRLPGVFREYASAVWTDVIGKGSLFSIGTRRLTVCEAHNGDNGEPPFDSSVELVVQGYAASISSRST